MATRTLSELNEAYLFYSSLGNTLELPESTNLVEGFIATIINDETDSTSVTLNANSLSNLDKIMHPTSRSSKLVSQTFTAMPDTCYQWILIKHGHPVSEPLWFCINPGS